MDEADPVESVLSVAEVLEMILDHLDKDSLLNCRRVNKFWNKGASSILKKRPTWIQVDSSSNSFGRLYRCVNKSSDFPFSGLRIIRPRAYRRSNVNLQLKKYLQKFGKLHTHVRLDVLFTKNVDKLLSSFSRMKFLEVGYVSQIKGQLESFCMPSVRTLSCKNLRLGRTVIPEIIMAAPALEKIENIDCGFEELLLWIWDTKRDKLVSSMILNNSPSPDVCRKLVASPPALTGLSIGYIDTPVHRSSPDSVVAAIRSILFASQDTLKKLSFRDFSGQQDEIPAVFSQLQELQIVTRCEDVLKIFPSLSPAGFPQLQRIRLSLVNSVVGEDATENCNLLAQSPLETVNTLELDSYFYLDPKVVEYLSNILPRVSHIRVKYPDSHYWGSEFQRGASGWFLKSFSFLSKLHIRDFPLNPSNGRYVSLDQYLTGISCKEVRTTLGALPKFERGSFYSNIQHPNGSLVQLKGLKELTISVKVPYNAGVEQLSRENPFISMISVWYALELLPGLRTTFLCQPSDFEVVKKALEPVEGYVSLVKRREPIEY